MEKKEVYIERAKIIIDEQITKLEQLKTKLHNDFRNPKERYGGEKEDSYDNLKARFEELGIDIYNSFKKFLSKGSSKGENSEKK